MQKLYEFGIEPLGSISKESVNDYFTFSVLTLGVTFTISWAGTLCRNSSSSSGSVVVQPNSLPRVNALSLGDDIRVHQFSAVAL